MANGICKKVDLLFELQQQAKELDAQMAELKTIIKDHAKKTGEREIVGKTAKAVVSSKTATSIGFKELETMLNAMGMYDLLPELVSVKVMDAKKMLGTSIVDQIGKVTVDPYAMLTVKALK